MSALAAFFAALPQLLKLLGFFIDVIQKTPAEERRDALAQFDSAIEKATVKDGPKDLTDLSKWFGKRL